MPTILVADDNSNIHKMVESALKDFGYKIEKVGNGEHAVKKLAEVKPDLILADIFMPVRNGYEVCEYVKSNDQFAHIPVVLLLGKFDPRNEGEERRVRADGLLMKPFVPPQPLITMVQTLLEEAARKRPAKPDARSPEKTVELSASEVGAMTGVAPEPEPEMPAYSVQAPRVEITEENKPLAFGDLLSTEETPPEPEAQKEAGFMASSVAGIEIPEEKVAELDADTVVEPPSTGEIVEPQREPSPDEPPIKVEFGPPEEMELVTDESSSGGAVEAAPLPELASSPDEWMASAPPPAAPPAAEESAVAAPPPVEPAPPPPPAPEPVVMPAPEPVFAPPPPPPPPPAPVPPPLAYEKPKLEEFSAPPAQADAVPAQAPAPPETPAPAPAAVAAPPAPVESLSAPAQIDPALVDAVVEKIVARLQPHVIEQITREIVRPLAEALLRRELGK